MPIRPTFYGFEMARTAMSASQKNIDITGQNIANINTLGYSRQRVSLSSVGAGGINWKYALHPSELVGLGVNVDSIKRVRDQFLDTRFRTELSENSRFAVKLDVLGYVESNIDEFIGDTGTLHSIVLSFQNALNDLHMNNTSEAEFINMTRNAANQLVTTSRTIANRINIIYDDTYEQLKFITDEVNRIAQALEDINKEIRNQYLLGAVSNELLDQRDLFLDQLSSYGNVTTRPAMIEKNGVLVDSGGVHVYFGILEGDWDAEDHGDWESSLLVSGTVKYHANLEISGKGDQPVKLSWVNDGMHVNGGNEFILTAGEIFACYEMLNGTGEIGMSADPETADFASKGIPYFMNMINTFISEFAEVFNDLNVDMGDLFVANDGGADITAANIAISDEWLTDPDFLLRTIDATGTQGAARNDNILRMIHALKEPREFTDVNGTIYKGSFLEYLGSVNTEMALEVSYLNRRKDTSDINLLSIDMYRASIMDVDSDEEAMNLMKFQKSYNAAIRFMTTLDEMLEMIINRMGIVGR